MYSNKVKSRFVGWSFLEKFYGTLLGVVYTFFFAREYELHEFGHIQAVVAISGLFVPFVLYGGRDLMVQYINSDKASRAILLVHIIISGFLLNIFLATIIYFSFPEYLDLGHCILFGLVNFLHYLSWFRIYFEEAINNYRRLAIISVISVSIVLLLRIYIVSNSLQIWMLLLTIPLVPVFRAVMFRFRKFDFSHYSVSAHKNLLMKGWPLVMSSLAVTLYMRLDQLTLTYFFSLDLLGEYALTIRMLEIVNIVGVSVLGVLFTANMNAKSFIDSNIVILRSSFVLVLILSASLFFVGPTILRFIIGKDLIYVGYNIKFMFLLPVFTYYSMLSDKYFLLIDRRDLIWKKTLLSLLLMVILNLVAVIMKCYELLLIGTLIAQLFAGILFGLGNRHLNELNKAKWSIFIGPFSS